MVAELFSFNAVSSQSEIHVCARPGKKHKIHPSTKLIPAGFGASDSVGMADALWDNVIGCGIIDGSVR